MIDKGKVSVVISTYNQEQFISRTIDSIKNQTYKNWELFIINDGSTDKTDDYIFTINDSRIKIISHNNRLGGSYRLNEGFKLCNGEYHTWIASDNTFEPTAFEEMINTIEKYKVDGVYANTKYIDKNDNVLYITERPDFDLNLLMQPMFYFVGVIFMYKHYCFDEIGGYSEKYLNANDLMWWLQFGYKYKVKLNKKILGSYRDHSYDKRYDGNWQNTNVFINQAETVINEFINKNKLNIKKINHKIVYDKNIIRWLYG